METTLTGYGHQYRAKEKAYSAAVQSINQAINDLKGLDDAESMTVKLKLLNLASRCENNVNALNESYNQNA